MQRVDVRLTEEEPSGISEYPHFLLTHMLKAGICRLEAAPVPPARLVDWVLTPRLQGESGTIRSQSNGEFRAVLAALGWQLAQNPYRCHTLFEVEFPHEGRPAIHRFSLFLCNEPAMAIWVKLYLYCIDGVWPTGR